MGIKSLKTLIEKYAKEAITEKHLNTYKNEIITIDTSIYMYRIKYSNNNRFIEGFIKQIIRLLRNGIIPVYIFDGKPPKEKKNVLQTRKDKKVILNDRIKEVESLINQATISPEILKDISKFKVKELVDGAERLCTIDDLKEEFVKLNKRNICVKWTDFDKLKELFGHMGIPYIVSNGEAETLCAKLCRCGMVKGCLSEDMDCLPNGGTIFLRKFNSNKNIVNEFNLNVILEKMEITYEQFVDICILCGCDYCPKISGIGPVNAYKLIKKHKCIECVLNNLSPRNIVPENFDYQNARNLFICEYDGICELAEDMILKQPHMEDLVQFMTDNEVSSRTYNIITKSLIKYYKNII
tara:strand:- start:2302 stop:3360 length:1059 start_codon:yes stop_codon:yes gene_type:complete